MPFRDRLDCLDIAEMPVYMYRNDGTGFLCDERLDLIYVNRVVLRIHITEHRCQSIADDRVRGRCKRERCCDNFSGKSHCLNQKFQCHVPVGKQQNISHFQIFCQFLLQSVMLLPHICQPVAFKNTLYLVHILIQFRHG